MAVVASEDVVAAVVVVSEDVVAAVVVVVIVVETVVGRVQLAPGGGPKNPGSLGGGPPGGGGPKNPGSLCGGGGGPNLKTNVTIFDLLCLIDLMIYPKALRMDPEI